MRTRAVWLMAVCLIGYVHLGLVYGQTNMLTNGGFESGDMESWGTYGAANIDVVTECVGAAIPEGPIEGDYCLHLVVPAAGANFWDNGMYDNNHTFEQGKKYTLACFMKCKTGTMQVNIKPEHAADPYEAYNELVATITEEWVEYYTTTNVFTTTVTPASATFHFAFDPGEFWMDDIRLYEGDYVPAVIEKTLTASSPSPANEAVDVRYDTALSWEPGPYAATHNVYFGTTFDDVSDAGVDSPLLVSTGQTATTFELAELLDFGQTYYWRVDEVNAAPDVTVHKGNVWSFTVEPALYPVQNVIATASIPTAEASGGPEVAVDESGLTDDLHGTADLTMWSGKIVEGEVPWIQFDFDRAYKLYGIHVWNYNSPWEQILGFGVKDVTIEYATEPNEWVAWGDHTLTQSAGRPTCAGERIDLDGIVASAIRINLHSAYKSTEQVGLAEVRFFEKPVVAREPEPALGATEVDPDVVLSWRPGREAVSHQVYLSSDANAVIDGIAAADIVSESAYYPGALDLGTQYFWRVDEVNEAMTPSVWAGNVWSFTTKEFFSIDDFESYTDEDGQRIYQTWLDGFEVATNGSIVGHDLPPYAEQAIRHSGRQSMPLYYNNTGNTAYSEAERAFAAPLDLTANGASTLSLHYQGVPTGFAKVSEDEIIMNGIGTDIWGMTDQFRFVYKQLSGNGSIIARIDHLDNTDEWAKAGVMIRERLDSDSALVDGIITSTLRAGLQWRTTRGADMDNPNTSSNTAPDAFELPQWIKLTRNGDLFTVQHSEDGENWLGIVPDTAGNLTSVTVSMPDTVYIGLAVTSHNTARPAGARFSEIATTGNVSGQWQSAAIGTDQVAGNGIDTFYIAVEDSSGQKATLVHPDPYAVAVGTWRQWTVDLSDLAASGVNIERIAKFYVGVGDRTQPSRNASGVLYIDDIVHGRPIE